MKKLSFRIAVAALFLVIGSMSLSAQIGRGGECLFNGDGNSNNGSWNTDKGICYTQLTEEQQVALAEFNAEYQAIMEAKRALMWTTTNILEKRSIWKEMAEMREAHWAEVQAYLESLVEDDN